jgi:hypothetical protein
VFQYDRLRRRDPLDAARRHFAIRLADVLPDGHVIIVAGEDVREAERLPHLRKTRIDVEEDFSPRAGKDFRIVRRSPITLKTNSESATVLNATSPRTALARSISPPPAIEQEANTVSSKPNRRITSSEVRED